MTATVLSLPTPSHSERLYLLLDRVDYRIAVNDEDREAVFRLRYDAYLKEQMIAPSLSERLSDRYDDLDNTMIFGLWLDGQLASTLRITVASEDYPESPAIGSFGDVLVPLVADGKVLIDATRFATREDYSRRYPGLMPYVTTRIAWMATSFYGADLFLGSVRTEHQAFYKRVLGGVVASEPRNYHGLMKPLSLMICDYRAEKERVELRNPCLRSSYFERRAMFAGQTMPGIQTPEAIPAPAFGMLEAAEG